MKPERGLKSKKIMIFNLSNFLYKIKMREKNLKIEIYFTINIKAHQFLTFWLKIRDQRSQKCQLNVVKSPNLEKMEIFISRGLLMPDKRGEVKNYFILSDLHLR